MVTRTRGRVERPLAREYSAGGVAVQGGKVLMVEVRNLEGRVLWTFPKGHLEPGETPRQAALREVEEETGYRCEILAPLTVTRYQFQRRERRVHKQVRWYLMRPERQTGRHDGEEVLSCAWVPASEASGRLFYPADFRLLDLAVSKASI